MAAAPSLFDSLMEGTIARVESHVRRTRRGTTRVDSYTRVVDRPGLRPLVDPTPGLADSPGESARKIAWRKHVSRFDPPRPRSSVKRLSPEELNRKHTLIVGLTAKLQSERQKRRASASATERALRRELSAYLVWGGTETDTVKRARSLVKRPKRIRESLMDSLMERG